MAELLRRVWDVPCSGHLLRRHEKNDFLSIIVPNDRRKLQPPTSRFALFAHQVHTARRPPVALPLKAPKWRWKQEFDRHVPFFRRSRCNAIRTSANRPRQTRRPLTREGARHRPAGSGPSAT